MPKPTALPERIAAVIERSDEADDALRGVVETLAAEPGVTWAGIAFLEGGELVLGPQSGRADENRRRGVPILFEGSPVGELRVDGGGESVALEPVAELIAPFVLIGWDTGGETWEP